MIAKPSSSDVVVSHPDGVVACGSLQPPKRRNCHECSARSAAQLEKFVSRIDYDIDEDHKPMRNTPPYNNYFIDVVKNLEAGSVYPRRERLREGAVLHDSTIGEV